MGRRIEKKFTTVIDGITKLSTWTYVYDNDNIALEIYTNEAGVTEKTWYTHGSGTDEHLALERNSGYYYFHADGLGSITNITDTHKAVVQSYDYDSFGMVKPSTSFRNNYTYTGREWDKETGLYYYRARYYDPMEGRFISKDPKGYEDSTNLYEYALGNPTNFVDPEGTTVQTCCGMSGQLPLPVVMNGLECMSKCLKTTILISSGWRTSTSNAAAGGAKKSYHMLGLAADVHEPPSKEKLRKAAVVCGFSVLPKQYPNRIHVDVRTKTAPKCDPDECKCKEIREGN